MPGKTKQDYLDIPVPAGASQARLILADAVANKGVNPNLKCLKYRPGGQIEVCVCKGMDERMGLGASKAEAIADACAKH